MARLEQEIRGIAVLSDTWEPLRIVTADTSVTESDPRPGTSVAVVETSKLRPQILGAQSADTSMAVYDSGYPDRNAAGLFSGATMTYRLASETDADRRVQYAPIRVTNVHGLAHSSGVDTSEMSIARLDDHSYLIMTANLTTAQISKYDPWTNAVTVVDAAETAPIHPVICRFGEGVFIIGDTRTERSLDGGVTWTEVSSQTEQDIGNIQSNLEAGDVRRSAVVDASGTICIAEYQKTEIKYHQYASVDGIAWTEVLAGTGTNVLDVDVTEYGGSLYFIVATLTNAPKVVKLASAYDDPIGTDGVEVFALAGMDRCSIVADYSGNLWAMAREPLDSPTEARYRWRIAVSSDEGKTWFYPGNTASAPYNSPIFNFGQDDGAAQVFADEIKLFPNPRGGLLALMRYSTDAGGDSQIVLLQLGQTCAPYDFYPKLRAGKSQYIPCVEPNEAAQWVKTGTGAVSLNGATGALDFSVTATNSAVYTDTSTFVAQTDYIETIVQVTADGGTAAGFGIRYRGQLNQTNSDCHFSVYFDTDGFTVADILASTLSTKTLWDFTQKTHFMLQANKVGSNIELRIEYGLAGSGIYQTPVTFTVITPGTALLTAQRGFGFYSAASSTATGSFFFVDFSETLGISMQPSGIDNGGVLWALSDTTNKILSRLKLNGGPGYSGEIHTVERVPGYPIENVFPTVSPSPAHKWRSTSKAENRVAVDMGRDTLIGGSHSVCLFVSGANFRTLTLQGKIDGGASYSTIGTLDLAQGFTNRSFSRFGNCLRPAVGTAGARYIWDNELAGGHVVLNPSGTPFVRRIKGNLAGYWDASAAGVQALIFLDDIDETEPTSGTINIVWPAGVLVLHLPDETSAQYRYLRALVPSSNLAKETYYTAGVIAPFALSAFGKQWGNGWEWTNDPNTAGVRDTYGTERQKQLGPNRRILTFTFDHGMKLDYLRGGTEDYIGADGKAKLAARDEVWKRLDSILFETEGGSRPVLTLMADPGHNVTLTDPTLYLYGYMAGSVRAQNAEGAENENEFMRAGPIRIEEIA